MPLDGVAECDHLDVSVPLDTGMSVNAALSKMGGVTITSASFHESSLRVMIRFAFSDRNVDGPLHHTADVAFSTDGVDSAIWSCSSMALPSATTSACASAPSTVS